MVISGALAINGALVVKGAKPLVLGQIVVHLLCNQEVSRERFLT
jgi:UDP-N-acetylglucosamine enolpyruvyl transferase